MAISYNITSREFASSGKGSTTEWILVGTIQGADRVNTSELDISPYRSKDIAVKVRVHGAQSIAPELSKIEIEYMPIGKILRSVTANVLALEDIKLLDMTKENKAAFIAATLYSCSESQEMFVVAFPHPSPVGHTMRCQVKLRPPGNLAPVLGYDHPISSEFSVQFDEL